MKQKIKILTVIGLMTVGMSACHNTSKPSNTDSVFSLTGKKRQQIVKQVRQRYYFQQLSKTEQENYLTLYDSLAQFREIISLTPVSKKSLIKTIDAFVMDNPEFYWITSADYRFEFSDQTVFVTFPIPEDAKNVYQDFKQSVMISSQTRHQRIAMSRSNIFMRSSFETQTTIKKPLKPINQAVNPRSLLIKTLKVFLLIIYLFVMAMPKPFSFFVKKLAFQSPISVELVHLSNLSNLLHMHGMLFKLITLIMALMSLGVTLFLITISHIKSKELSITVFYAYQII